MEDNNQNSSNYVAIDALIELLNEQTGRDYSSKKALVSEWILEAERKIGTGRNTEPVRNYPIDVQRYLAKLPVGCYKVTDVDYCVLSTICSCGQSPCVCNTCSCGSGWAMPNHTVLSNGGAIRNSCICGAYYNKNKAIDWKRQGCFLLLPFPTGGVTIDYTKIPVDSAGLPYILEEHLDAILQFGVYKFTDAQVILGRMNPSVSDRAFIRWGDLCAQARGGDLLPTEQRSTYAATINNDPRKFTNKY